MDKQDIFNYYVGGLALLSAIVSVTIYSRSYLPNAQMLVLNELLSETRQLYEKSQADGLLPDTFCKRFDKVLEKLEDNREELRERTYRAINVFDQCVELLLGLSRNIGRVSDAVKKLRSYLVTTSERNRRSRDKNRSIICVSSNEVTAPHNVAMPTSSVQAQMTCDITDCAIIPCKCGNDECTTGSLAIGEACGQGQMPILYSERSIIDVESDTDTVVDTDHVSCLRPLVEHWRSSRLPSGDDYESTVQDAGLLPV